MTQFQNTHGFLSTRKRMRDLWVGVGNLGNLGVGKSLVLRQESYLNSYFSQLKAIYIKRLIVAHGRFLDKLDKEKTVILCDLCCIELRLVYKNEIRVNAQSLPRSTICTRPWEGYKTKCLLTLLLNKHVSLQQIIEQII